MDPNEIESHIRNRYADKSFDVCCLAHDLELSESYLREIINLNYECSPHHLIETIRLENAILLFGGGRLNIYAICSKAGYANLKTFRTAFKKRLGMTPVQLRDLIRKSNQPDQVLRNQIKNL
jgi:AraC-like DNA-binding protein